MPERERPYFWDKPIPRKSFNNGIIKAGEIALLGGAVALRNGITLKPVETSGPVNQERISVPGYKPITVAHKEGNTPEGIIAAKESRMTFADLDTNDKLEIGHGQNLRLGKVVIGGFDRQSWTFRLGPPRFHLEEAFELAGDLNIGLFIELKRGDFKPKAIESIFKWSQANHVPTLVHSEDMDRVDMARHTIGGDPSKFIYVPKKTRDWIRFFGEQDREERRAVLTNPGSIKWQRPMLKEHDITVFAGNVFSPQTAEDLVNEGVRGFFNKRQVLTNLFEESEQPVMT